jgi:hypothetical protein
VNGTIALTDGIKVSDEMRAVEADYPDWHLFATLDGTIWAVTSHTPWKGRGITLDARTPELMRHEIAAEEHRWERVPA